MKEEFWKIPGREAPEDIFVLTKSPEAAPDKPTYLEIDFKKGKSGNCKRQKDVAGKTHGLYEYDCRGQWHRPRGYGGKPFCRNESRGVYETPGGTVLWAAHRAVESITMDREVMIMRIL